MMFSRVVLPDPEAPTTETRCARATSKSTPRRARTGTSAPKLRLTPRSRTKGSMSAPAPLRGLEADDHPVPGGERAVLGDDADKTVCRQTGPDCHELGVAVH